MSNINNVQNAAPLNQAIAPQSASQSSQSGTNFGDTMAAQAAQPTLTPAIAKSLMYRSMTTGVQNSELEQYGGYEAVKNAFEANGGTYNLQDIPSEKRLQLAQEVATSGIGNMALPIAEHIPLSASVIQALTEHGIDPSILRPTQAGMPDAQSSVNMRSTKGTSEGLKITPSAAKDLIDRSMTTGVANSEFEKYGGYDAVKTVFENNDGKYSIADIPKEQRRQLAQQVANSGIGNMSLPLSEHIPLSNSLLQSLSSYGVDVTNSQSKFVDSNSFIDSFIGSQKS